MNERTRLEKTEKLMILSTPECGDICFFLCIITMKLLSQKPGAAEPQSDGRKAFPKVNEGLAQGPKSCFLSPVLLEFAPELAESAILGIWGLVELYPQRMVVMRCLWCTKTPTSSMDE